MRNVSNLMLGIIESLSKVLNWGSFYWNDYFSCNY